MTDDVDTRLKRSKHWLAQKIAQHCAGRDLTTQTLHEVDQIYEDHRTAARQGGLDFPELVVLVMDVRKTVHLVRRDLDESGIDNLVVELAQSQQPMAYYDPQEIARAVRRAFPHHRAADPRDRRKH